MLEIVCLAVVFIVYYTLLILWVAYYIDPSDKEKVDLQRRIKQSIEEHEEEEQCKSKD